MHLLRAVSFSVIAYALIFCAYAPYAHANTVAAQRAALQAQLDQINTQISQNQSQLGVLRNQRASYERDLKILDAQILVAKLQIKQRDLTIQKIKDEIAGSQAGIESLDQKVIEGEKSIAQMMRETNEIDRTAFIQILLNDSLPNAFRDLDDFATLQKRLDEAFSEMAVTRNNLSTRKQVLQDKEEQESDLLAAQQAQAMSLQATEKQKQALVSAAKGQESIYLQVISNQQKNAKQIEAQLFALRDTTKSVSFGDMFTYAKEASAKTGVRPAIILGILAEESNLGQNVGTGSWRVDMHPTRDAPVYQQICAALGINPDSMRVSKKPWYGWGGAMGPAQFIPSTWKLYADRIAQASGQNPPNPWDPRTAAFAAAILMMDNGADKQTPAAERLAALRYLAGWKNASKAAYSFYGDDVMNLAAKFQQQIEVINE